MQICLLAGLLLYAADIAMRMTQASNITTITAWRVIGKGSNRAIVFTLPVDKVKVLLRGHDVHALPGQTPTALDGCCILLVESLQQNAACYGVSRLIHNLGSSAAFGVTH